MISKQTIFHAALAGLAFSLACSAPVTSAVTTTPTPHVAIEATSATPPLPDRIDDLCVLAPKDARVVLSLPNLDGLRAQLDVALWAGIEAAIAHLFREALGMEDQLAARVLGAYDGSLTFDTKGPETHGALAIRFRDPAVIAPIVAAAGLEPNGPDRWKRGALEMTWLAKAKIAILATDGATLDATLDRARGVGRDFVGSPLHQQRRRNEPWVSVDLARLDDDAPKKADAESRLLVWIDTERGVRVDYTRLGKGAPRLGDVIAPGELGSMGALPAGAGAALGISMARTKGSTVRNVIDEIAATFDGGGIVATLIESAVGVDLPVLDRALGDEVAIGFYPADKWPEKRDRLLETGALFARITMRDEKIAKQMVDHFADGAKKKYPKGFKAGPDRFDAMIDQTAITVEAYPDEILFAMGVPAVVSKLKTNGRSPKVALRNVESFVLARAGASPNAHALFFLDVDGLAKASSSGVPELASLPDADLMFSVGLKPNPRGTDASFLVAASGPVSGAATVIGIVGTIGQLGMQRYLAEAKTAEARSALGAIGRDVVASYEREQPSGKHAICGAAAPVPADVPKGKAHTPSDVDGKDFATGTNVAGWRCLRFTMTTPHFFQYTYRVGKDYKGPKRGGPNPGPNGFEISAEGDLDGDGKTSLFTLTGKVDAQGRKVTLAPEIFSSDELE